jgi:flagellar export protein FliJ
MGFRFTLDSVLRFREGIEKREELALQKVQFEVARIRRRIDELTEELAKAGNEREEALQTWMQAFRLKDLQDEMSAAVEARQILLETLETLKSQREAQMKVYQAARVNRRMLTDLQKQQRETWEQSQHRIEQKRLDDVFASRAHRG